MAGGFGRRASDGGANLQTFFHSQISESGFAHANSQEQLAQVSQVVPTVVTCGHSQPLPLHSEDLGLRDELDRTAIEKYISGRGATQRVTLPIVGQKESSMDLQRKITPIRSRKTGLHTVTERPPEINPELIYEVEERIKRAKLTGEVSPLSSFFMSGKRGRPTDPLLAKAHLRRSSAPLYYGRDYSKNRENESYGLTDVNTCDRRLSYHRPKSLKQGNKGIFFSDIEIPSGIQGGIMAGVPVLKKSSLCSPITGSYHPYPYPASDTTVTFTPPPSYAMPTAPSFSSPSCTNNERMNLYYHNQSMAPLGNHSRFVLAPSCRECLSSSSNSSSSSILDSASNDTVGGITLHQNSMRLLSAGKRRKSDLETVVEFYPDDPQEEETMETDLVGRESYKDASVHHFTCERYSPLSNFRRASDSTISLSDINQEFQKLQKHSGMTDSAAQAELQRGHFFIWRQGGTSPVGTSRGSSLSPTPPPLMSSTAPSSGPLPMTVCSCRCQQPISSVTTHPHLSFSNRSPISSPPMSSNTSPSIPGSPLHHTNVEGTVLSLSQLQLQATSGSTSPHTPLSPLQQTSPPRCYSPQPSSGSGSPLMRTVATPPPLSLDSIREEPHRPPFPLSLRPPSCNPQISITSDTGDQTFISDSSSSCSEGMDVSPLNPENLSLQHPHFCISRGPSLDSPFSCSCEEEDIRPSITRGTGISYMTKVRTDNATSRKNERNLTRQDAVENAANKHQVFITSNTELRHSFPPLNYSDVSHEECSIDSDYNVSNPPSPKMAFQQREELMENTPQRSGSGSLLFGVPNKWSRLPVSDIVGAIIALIDSRAPSLVREEVRERGLSLRDSAGTEVELEVSCGPASDSRALKMRRVSGDDSQYSQLCQELINCMTT